MAWKMMLGSLLWRDGNEEERSVDLGTVSNLDVGSRYDSLVI